MSKQELQGVYDGQRVIGTSDRLDATCLVNTWQRTDSGEIEPLDYGDETKVDWDSQTTIMAVDRSLLCVLEDGSIVPASQVTWFAEGNAREMKEVSDLFSCMDRARRALTRSDQARQPLYYVVSFASSVLDQMCKEYDLGQHREGNFLNLYWNRMHREGREGGFSAHLLGEAVARIKEEEQ